MTGSKHTPGPWVARHNAHYWQIDSKEYGQIGDTCSSNYAYFNGDEVPTDECEKFAEANAHLIAAAPDLLEALENVVIAVSMGWDLDGVVARAEAAIAKARGNVEN